MLSTLIFLDIALAIQNLLWSHINFKIVFSTSVSKKLLEKKKEKKIKSYWNLDRDYMESMEQQTGSK